MNHDLENPMTPDIENQYKSEKKGNYKIIRKAKIPNKKSSSLLYFTPKTSSGIGYGQYVDIENDVAKGKKKYKTKNKIRKNNKKTKRRLSKF